MTGTRPLARLTEASGSSHGAMHFGVVTRTEAKADKWGVGGGVPDKCRLRQQLQLELLVSVRQPGLPEPSFFPISVTK